MRRSRLAVALVLLALLQSGCGTHQVCQDQDKLRCCLLNLYTNQIMDNLVRAYNGLPIIQLDYSQLTATVTLEETGSYGGSQQLAATNLLTLPPPVLAITRGFTNGFAYMLSGRDNNQVTMTANPVTNKDEVYNAYLQFLAKPGSLVVTCDPPPEGAAHIVKCCGHKYYWVPVEFKFDFLRLALVTTAQRGQPLSVPTYFENTVTKLLHDEKPAKDDPDQSHILTLKFDKPMPNDDGKVTLTVANVPYVLKLFRNPKVGIGEQTDEFRVIYSQAATKLTPEQLVTAMQSQTLRIDLSHFRPQLPSTEELIQAIRNGVELIRLNQLRTP
jgi:hypothetical protein